MEEAIRFLYAISHVAAFVMFCFSGFWRQFPICSGMLTFSSALAITYNPESPEWIRSTYLTLEPAAVLLRFCAVLEVLWKLSEEIENRHLLLIGLSSAAVAATAAVWAIEPGGTVYTFVQLRRYAQIATAVMMVAGVLFFWSQSLWNWSVPSFHAAILFVLTAKQAIYSLLSMRGLWQTNQQWHAADWPGLLITSLCCLAWAILASSAQKHAQDAEA